MDQLNKWFEPYQNIDRLSILDAQRLSKLAREETNDFVKKRLYDRLILGTMYVIYNYIVNNKLYLTVSQNYDLEDLTSSFTRQWITLIKNGDLEKYDSFSLAMNVFALPAKAIQGVTNDKATESVERADARASRFLFTKNNIEKYIDIYSKIVRQKGICEVSDFEKELEKNGDYLSTLDIDLIIKTFDELSEEGWIKRFFYKDTSSPSDFEVINSALKKNKVSIFDEEIAEPIDSIDSDIDIMAYKDIALDLISRLDDDRMKFVITKRYGLDGDSPWTIEQVANELGISRSRVQQMEHRIYSIFRTKAGYYGSWRDQPQYSKPTLYSWVKKGYPIDERNFGRLSQYLDEIELKVARMLYSGQEVRTKAGICEELGLSSNLYDNILKHINEVLNKIKHIRTNFYETNVSKLVDRYKPPRNNSRR